MVYLHFPSNFTEEELMLQAKYNKLKRKKKALQDLKAPKPEPERTPQAPKRPTEARDAREVAKKLIKSGVITAPKTPKRPEQAFKRPRGLERKLNSTEKLSVASYQPFSATQPGGELLDDEPPPLASTLSSSTAATSLSSSEHSLSASLTVPGAANRPKVKSLYESFVSAGSSAEGSDKSEQKSLLSLANRSLGAEPRPIKGNTIFVTGYKINEELLKKHFTTFGNILKVNVEADKKGFITFEKSESAERAISEMDGIMASSIQLKVSMARRQPVIEPVNDTASSSMWSSLAASYTQKSAHKDKRGIKVYDDDIF